MKTNFGEMLYLKREDVIAAGGNDMLAAIAQTERMLTLFENSDCIVPPKAVLRWSDDPKVENTKGRVNFLSAYAGGDIDVLGMKWIGSFPNNKTALNLPRATALIILNDPVTGIPIAIMEGSVISATRTAAMTGVAIKYLARSDSKVVGIIGAGVLSKAHIHVLHALFENIERIQLYNPTRANAVKLKAEIEAELGFQITLVDTPDLAFNGSDITLTATTTHDPIVHSGWLAPGMLSIQIAGHEYSFDAVKKADKIVCDDWEGLKHRGIMSPAKMYQAGLLKDEDIYANLSEIVTGKKPGRKDQNEHIHFATVGMGLSDVAIAAMVYQRALEHNIGIRIPLWDKPC